MVAKYGIALALLAVGCGAASSEVGTSNEDVVSAGNCPKTTLAEVAAQAARCGVAPPEVPARTREWRHAFKSSAIAKLAPHHRGRDTLLVDGEPQWVLAKLAYGPLDIDLKDEAVDIYVQRGCDGAWESLGEAISTADEGQHETVDGVEDKGSRVYARIPDAKRLPVGHHRVRVVVRGDGTFADQEIEVLPRGTPLLVSDVDGTLTERVEGDSPWVCDEESDFPALWRGLLDKHTEEPLLHEGAAALYTQIVSVGYRPVYLTARPEWLVPHTRAFLLESNRHDGRGDLPRGIVHTTLGLTGAFDSAAQAFKEAEMKALEAKGFVPIFGFGNRPSDVATYDGAKVPYRYYFRNPSTEKRLCSKVADLPTAPAQLVPGDFQIGSYTQLLPAVQGLCR